MTREEAIKIFNTVLFFDQCDCPKEEIEECLNIAIKALKQEPKTGHWIIIDDCEQFIAKCSECGEPSGLNNTYARYCPWCGAKMIGPQESEE